MSVRLLTFCVLAQVIINSVAMACDRCQQQFCAGGLVPVGCTCIRIPGCIIPPVKPPITIGPTGKVTVTLLPGVPKEAENIIKGKVIDKVDRLGADTLHTVRNAAGSSLQTLTRAGGDTITTVKLVKTNTIRTVEKAGKDATATYIKGWRDTTEQSKRSFKDAVDATKAMANFEKNQLAAQRDAVARANKRLRDRDVIGAMWGLATDPQKASEKNFFRATQESKLVNQAAAAAASIYGGPAGAAAYAAWQTYRMTGDANLAFRAGILAGATAELGSSVEKMPTGTAREIFEKAVLAGTAGGIAVAAAGGDERAIKDGFLKSGGAVLIQGGNDKFKAYSPKMADAYDSVQCISTRDLDCLQKMTWVRDAKGKILYDEHGNPRFKMLDSKSLSGKWTQDDPNSPKGKALAFITGISKLPNSASIPVLKNEWVLSWTAGKDQTIPYGRPTVVLTYVGDNVPFVSSVEYGRLTPGSLVSAQPAAASATSGTLTYQCPFEGNSRTVKVTMTASGCTAIYARQDGKRQTVWESEHEPGICAPKAAQFVQYLSHLAIHCTAQP